MNPTPLLQEYDWDLNLASYQRGLSPLIPNGTFGRVEIHIEAGNNSVTESKTLLNNDLSLYVNAKFILVDGEYAGHTISQRVDLYGFGLDSLFKHSCLKAGRALVRTIIESARAIHPEDESDLAQKNREIKGLGDIHGLICAIKIGIIYDDTYPGKLRNKVIKVITPAHPMYAQLMNIHTSSSL